MLNAIRRRVAELLEESSGPGRTKADDLAEAIVNAAIKGNIEAAKLLMDLVDQFDPTTQAAWDD
jgi:hypothetical protein